MRYGTEDLRDPVANKVLHLPDGKTMVSAGWTLRVWDIPTRKMTAEYPLPGSYAMSLACSPTGDKLYVCAMKFVVMNTADGKVLAEIEPPKAPISSWDTCSCLPASEVTTVSPV